MNKSAHPLAVSWQVLRKTHERAPSRNRPTTRTTYTVASSDASRAKPINSASDSWIPSAAP